jgi:hypothetical protein
MPDDLPAEFDEDASRSFRDHAFNSIHSVADDAPFAYCDADIDNLSVQLCIPWEPSKTIPFTNKVSFLGFHWNLSNRTVEITEEKKEKYKEAIRVWTSHTTHTLDNIQKLYGKLLHASLMVPAKHAYLTSLEAMLGTQAMNPCLWRGVHFAHPCLQHRFKACRGLRPRTPGCIPVLMLAVLYPNIDVGYALSQH